MPEISNGSSGAQSAPAIGSGAPPAVHPFVFLRGPRGRAWRSHAVRRLVRKLQVAAPHLQEVDIPVLRIFAEHEVLRTEIFARLKQEGFINSKSGEPRGLLETYRKLSQSQIAAANALRLTPYSRSALRREHETIDLAAALASPPEEAEVTGADEQRVEP